MTQHHHHHRHAVIEQTDHFTQYVIRLTAEAGQKRDHGKEKVVGAMHRRVPVLWRCARPYRVKDKAFFPFSFYIHILKHLGAHTHTHI